MEAEILSLADYAKDEGGKLTIVGVFSSINSHQFPCAHSFYLVGRFRFEPDEKWFDTITVRAYSEKDKENLFPEFVGSVNNLQGEKNKGAALNFVLCFNPLKFESEGLYYFEVSTNTGFVSRIPLKVNFVEG